MKRMLPLFAWLLALVSSDAMTAAWKVPLGNFVEDLGTDDRVKKLEEAPAKSAFFQEGDELWDISAALKWERRIGEPEDPFAEDSQPQTVVGFKWQGDWIVWNARSKLVIASGAWMDLKDAEEALGYETLPVLIRSRFEILSGEEGKPLHSISLISRSGEKAEASWEGASLSVEGTAGSREWVDLRWDCDWPTGEEGQAWSVLSAKTMKDGERTLLAGQGQGHEKWQLLATVALEAMDGIPRSQTRWIEKPEGMLPWQPEGRSFRPLRSTLPNGLQIGIFEMPAGLDQTLDPELKDKAALAEAPPQAIDWVRGHLLNARPFLALNGVKVEGEGSFAGIGAGGCLVVIGDAKALDLVTDIVTPLWDPPPLPVWVEANAEAGGWRLVTRSGEKAEIKRSRAEEELSLFSIEPTVGSGNQLADLRYTIDAMKGTTVLGRIESTSTLELGKPQKVASFSSNGEATDLILTVKEDGKP